jgi:hypothetical protein
MIQFLMEFHLQNSLIKFFKHMTFTNFINCMIALYRLEALTSGAILQVELSLYEGKLVNEDKYTE